VLVRLGAQEHVLRLVTHHIVADGWSIGILLRELGELYRTSSANEAPSLAPLPIQFADFALWERQQLQGEALETQVAFWRRYLEEAPDSVALPTDRTRPPLPSYRGAMHTVFLPEGLTGELKALGRRENVTLFMTLLAAFKVLLARYSGQDDLVVGSPFTGRNHVDLQGLIGFFVNTLPLRTNLSGDPSFREFWDGSASRRSTHSPTRISLLRSWSRNSSLGDRRIGCPCSRSSSRSSTWKRHRC